MLGILKIKANKLTENSHTLLLDRGGSKPLHEICELVFAGVVSPCFISNFDVYFSFILSRMLSFLLRVHEDAVAS